MLTKVCNFSLTAQLSWIIFLLRTFRRLRVLYEIYGFDRVNIIIRGKRLYYYYYVQIKYTLTIVNTIKAKRGNLIIHLIITNQANIYANLLKVRKNKCPGFLYFNLRNIVLVFIVSLFSVRKRWNISIQTEKMRQDYFYVVEFMHSHAYKNLMTNVALHIQQNFLNNFAVQNQ